MNRRARITGAMLLSLAASAPGCAGRSPWDSLAGTPDLPPPASVAANQGQGPLAALARYDGGDQSHFPEPSVQLPKPSGDQGSTFTGSMGAAVTSAFASAKDAITPEARVVRAPDPLSLSTPVGELGAEFYFASARLLENQGNTAKADELYRKALEDAPRDLNILLHYGRMHDRAGNLDQAAEIYRRAIASHPHDAAAYNDLGLCYARQNRTAESVETLKHAVARQPDSVLYRNNLATVLVERGLADDALSHLSAVHAPAAAHYNLAYLLYKRGKGEQAAIYAQQALERDPQMTAAEQLLTLVSARRPMEAPASRPISAQVSGALGPAMSAPGASPVIVGGSMPAASTPGGASRPQPLPAIASEEGEDWGEAPTPDDLPQLLPPVD